MAVVRLELAGMTCAACAARIERRLNRLDGVEAAVNFAAEQATVECADDVPVERLVGAVESAGYGARVAPGAHERHEHGEHAATLVRRLGLAALLTVPVALLAMVPPLQFGGW